MYESMLSVLLRLTILQIAVLGVVFYTSNVVYGVTIDPQTPRGQMVIVVLTVVVFAQLFRILSNREELVELGTGIWAPNSKTFEKAVTPMAKPTFDLPLSLR